MTLKEYVVVNHGDAGVCLWIREQWLTHLAEARKTSPGYDPPIITTFNADEQLQEQKGLRWVKASERVPDFKVITLVHLRFSTDKTGFKLTGYYKDGRWYRQHGEDNVLDWAPNLEWLEETEPGQPVPAGEWIDRGIPPKKDGHYEVAVYDSEHDECLNEFSGFIDGQWLCEPPYKKTRNRVTHWKSKTPLPTLSQAGG